MAKVHNRKGNEQVVIALGQNANGSLDAKVRTITDALAAFGVQIDEDVQEVFDEVGKEAVKMLKATSPKNTGKYSRGWRYKRQAKGKNGLIEAKIYNATSGQLTHILEFGHPKMSGDQVIGQIKGQPHIEPVNKWVQSEFPKRFTQKLQQKQ